MIIIGYPGVGKTTAAKNYANVIDFDISGISYGDEEIYCKLAEKLSMDGYTVCVSSRASVQRFFMKSTENVYAVYPSKEIKTDWIQHLRNRYVFENTDENLAAYEHAVNFFDNDIDDLSNRGFINIELTNSMFLSNVFYNSADTQNDISNNDENNVESTEELDDTAQEKNGSKSTGKN